MKIINVVGARPNFVKMAPVVKAMQCRADKFSSILVHTGQHYDAIMSDAFFCDLALPPPDVHLGVGSASHAQQTARVMMAFEPVVERERPDWVVVVGDVNSTLACALVCAKLGVPVAHVEAGLRSRDRTMPEEINRVLTDQIADLLLTPSADADANLIAEGIPSSRIKMVGNVMIDSLFEQLERASASTVREHFGVQTGEYAVATVHRPANTDDRERLTSIFQALAEVSRRVPVIVPLHPRTQKALSEFKLDEKLREAATLHLVEPLGYLDFLHLYSGAKLVLTDSGGIQEETTALGIPCLTLRDNTERPVTVSLGTNTIVGADYSRITTHAARILNNFESVSSTVRRTPPLWDGRTADRILDALMKCRE